MTENVYLVEVEGYNPGRLAFNGDFKQKTSGWTIRRGYHIDDGKVHFNPPGENVYDVGGTTIQSGTITTNTFPWNSVEGTGQFSILNNDISASVSTSETIKVPLIPTTLGLYYLIDYNVVSYTSGTTSVLLGKNSSPQFTLETSVGNHTKFVSAGTDNNELRLQSSDANASYRINSIKEVWSNDVNLLISSSEFITTEDYDITFTLDVTSGSQLEVGYKDSVSFQTVAATNGEKNVTLTNVQSKYLVIRQASLEDNFVGSIENIKIKGLQKLYFSTTKMSPFPPTDGDRPNQSYDARLIEPATYRRFAFNNRSTTGISFVTGGEVVVSNADSSLDRAVDWGFGGRTLAVYWGQVTDTAFSSFSRIFFGTIEQANFIYARQETSKIQFRLRDSRQNLESINIQSTKYAGTNSGSSGNEGTEDDLKGKPKPLTFGYVYNVTPARCNVPGLRFQVNDGALSDVPAFYDNGVSLTRTHTTPSASEYEIDLDTGIITLGSSPAGLLTADVVNAQVLTEVLEDPGMESQGTTYWKNYGTPTTNDRSTEQVYAGTYSRKIVADASNEGIETVTRFSIETLQVFSFKGRVYSSTDTYITAVLYDHNGSSALKTEEFHISSSSWTAIGFTYITTQAYSNLALIVHTAGRGSGTYYFDDFTAGQLDCSPSGLSKWILEDIGGFTEFHTSEFTSYRTEAPYVCGFYSGLSESNILNVLDYLNSPVSGSIYFCTLCGAVAAGILEDPTGTPDISLDFNTLLEMRRDTSNDPGRGVPAYLISLSYARNWTVQDSDRVGGAVTAARKAWLEQEYRKVTATDSTVQDIYLLAPEIERNSGILLASPAQTEATRLLNLYSEKREFLTVVIDLTEESKSIDLFSVVKITADRFNYQSGKLFLILGLYRNVPDVNQLTLELWG